jgi:hypothetical protein
MRSVSLKIAAWSGAVVVAAAAALVAVSGGTTTETRGSRPAPVQTASRELLQPAPPTMTGQEITTAINQACGGSKSLILTFELASTGHSLSIRC